LIFTATLDAAVNSFPSASTRSLVLAAAETTSGCFAAGAGAVTGFGVSPQEVSVMAANAATEPHNFRVAFIALGPKQSRNAIFDARTAHILWERPDRYILMGIARFGNQATEIAPQSSRA
jgi:hypothetical protein